MLFRGGGPFGVGRLEGEELTQLLSALDAAMEVLRRDTATAPPPPAPAPVAATAVVKPKAQPQPPKSFVPPPRNNVSPVTVTPLSPSPTQVQSKVPSPSAPPTPTVVAVSTPQYSDDLPTLLANVQSFIAKASVTVRNLYIVILNLYNFLKLLFLQCIYNYSN